MDLETVQSFLKKGGEFHATSSSWFYLAGYRDFLEGRTSSFSLSLSSPDHDRSYKMGIKDAEYDETHNGSS